MWIYRIFGVILFLGFGVAQTHIFIENHEFSYLWSAHLDVGSSLPSQVSSQWDLNARLSIYQQGDLVQFQLNNITSSEEHGNASSALRIPFYANFSSVRTVSLLTENNDEPWSVNMKRSIVSLFQLNLDLFHLPVQSVHETGPYGDCPVEYVVSREGENVKVLKTLNLLSCTDSPYQKWSNLSPLSCPTTYQDGLSSYSERRYTLTPNISNQYIIQQMTATGNTLFQPFQASAESHYISVNQSLRLENIYELNDTISVADLASSNLIHQPLKNLDFSVGHKPTNKTELLEKVNVLLSEMSDSLLYWEVGVSGLDNETSFQALHLMWWFDLPEWEALYDTVTIGTSYRQETIQHLFWELVPQIGSTSSVLFIKNLVQSGHVKGPLAARLLTTFPFYVRHPSEELLRQCEDLIYLNTIDNIEEDVIHSGVLSFASFVRKTCAVKCSIDTLDRYTKIFLDRFSDSTEYKNQMLYIQVLKNMGLDHTLEFLSPIITNSSQNHHLRFLSVWAAMSASHKNPKKVSEVYWPILLNKTDFLEIRVAALTVLLLSNPSASRLISLYWFMKEETNLHLYNYFYTTIHSLAGSYFPCYAHLKSLASQIVRILPVRSSQWTTGNYLLDYENIARGCSGLIQLALIGSERTGLPDVIYFQTEQNSLGFVSQFSMYAKLTGVNEALKSEFLNKILKINEQHDEKLYDLLKTSQFPLKPKEALHVELIMQMDSQVILCQYYNQTTFHELINYFKKASSLYFEFSVNYQRLRFPMRYTAVQLSDIGTSAVLQYTTASLTSARGYIRQDHEGSPRNAELDLRYSLTTVTSLEVFNPLKNKWCGAQRLHSLHARIPFATQLLLHVAKSYIKITANRHKDFVDGSKLGVIWHSTTKMFHDSSILTPIKNNDDWSIESLDLGAKFGTKVFDCQDGSEMSNSLIAIKEAFVNNNKNYRMIPGGVFWLGLFSVPDYFQFLPSSGSCGLILSLSPLQAEPALLVEGGTMSMSMSQKNEIVWDLTSVYKELKDGNQELQFKLIHSNKDMNASLSPSSWKFMRLEGNFVFPSRRSGAISPPTPPRGHALISWGFQDFISVLELDIEPKLMNSLRDQWPTSCSDGTYDIPACLQLARKIETELTVKLHYSNLPGWLKIAINSLFPSLVHSETNSSLLQFGFPTKLPWTTQGMCALSLNSLMTFDGAMSNHQFNSTCYKVAVADCSPKTHFFVGVKLNEGSQLLDMKVESEGNVVEVIPKSTSNLTVIVNGAYMPNAMYTVQQSTNETNVIFRIKQWGSSEMLEVEVGNGVTLQHYGHSVIVLVSLRLRGTTCGFCGDFNDEPSNDFSPQETTCVNF
ncbi:unnamed protein product [Bemisia tabaci]|uniref:Vitellogenin n=1 Tax=Bemisia tabaci TaxID=7038 RepID=A0A9P0A4A0_BEMTA|nr:unnamed protein product [Bemisia tabaci]